MMELQKIILKQYILLYEEPTLKKIAADTGIQITRVFRLFNGSTMKLSEYKIFQNKIKEKMGLTGTLEELAYNCSLKLRPNAIKDIELYIQRKMKIWDIVNCSKQKNDAAKNQLA